MSRYRLAAFPVFLLVVWTAESRPWARAQTSPADLLEKNARAIHERIIVLDTHVDFSPNNLIGERNYTQSLDTQF